VARREKKTNDLINASKENDNFNQYNHTFSRSSSTEKNGMRIKHTTRTESKVKDTIGIDDSLALQNLSLEDNNSIPSSGSMDQSQISRSSSRMGRSNTLDNDDEDSIVQIELIQCDSCKRSFAPKVYEKHFDQDGQPKCATMTKKRAVFNSAKVSQCV
jgi:hypothetical protein